MYLNEGSTLEPNNNGEYANGGISGLSIANVPRDFNHMNRTFSGNFGTIRDRHLVIEFQPKINNFMEEDSQNTKRVFKR